jgi:hypothetical protein
MLGDGEVLLWSMADETKGIFRKKVTKSLAVTNYRIMRTDNQEDKILGWILVGTLDDVIVMNTHRVSQAVGYGFYGAGYTTSTRFSSGTSKTVGEIVFIINGQKVSWSGIPDPTGLKNFIKSIKRTMYDPLTKLETKSARSGIPCLNCNQQNLKNSKFCNGCGKALESVCTQCQKSNPLNSSYCGHCGFALQ